MTKKCIVVRGGGDLATGVVQALHQVGLSVVILESLKPSAIRRCVALSDAIYKNKQTVENISAFYVKDAKEAVFLLQTDFEKIPMLVDPECNFLQEAKKLDIQVTCLVDAIIAKKNLGTNKSMAPIVVALGPGFSAGETEQSDCDIVIETMRGHNLARLIYFGSAMPNTATPGVIGGVGKERVIHSPADGIIELVCKIGDTVTKEQVLAYVLGKERVCVKASITGVLRGIICDGYEVFKGMKIADIDPRITEQQNCFTISDKSRCLGNSTLCAILTLAHKKNISLW